MYGRESTPARVYAYGAKAPHEGADAYWREERAMHRLRNALVEIERDRREAIADAVRAHSPRLAEIESEIERIDGEVEELREAIKRSNQRERRRDPDPERRARIRELKAERKALWVEHKALRKEAYADPPLVEALEAVEATSKARRKALYAAREISWSNHNAVVQACGSMRSGPPPRFLRWNGQRGRIVVQIQGGASWEDLVAGHRQVRITPLPLPDTAKPGGRRSRRPWHELRLRIGRDARGDDRSEWVAVRFALHRPVPVDARIQQVWLVRRRSGTRDVWSVQFVVARANGWAKTDTVEASGACGVDLRWRRREDGSLLVAYVEGDDGHRESVEIPAARLAALRYAEGLRAVRDREFDGARDALVRWLSEREDVPDWLRETTATLAKWRSAARLAALVLRWREARFDGDVEIHERLEAWRAQDKHLADWEAAQRRKFERWRLDHYRRFAARLRWRYAVAVVEDADWRALLSRPPAEELDEPERLNRRWYGRAAAPGLIRQAIQQSIEDTRAVSAAGSSRTCSLCGAEPAGDWDAAADTVYRCQAGHQLPVWRNAARNLLAAASAEMVSESRSALDVSE